MRVIGHECRESSKLICSDSGVAVVSFRALYHLVDFVDEDADWRKRLKQTQNAVEILFRLSDILSAQIAQMEFKHRKLSFTCDCAKQMSLTGSGRTHAEKTFWHAEQMSA